MPDTALKFTIGRPGVRARAADLAVAAGATLLLALPALWNRFPLLEYDTGGYLARWYEGYLVPSRPAPYGLLLNLGAPFDFWPVVLLQAALTVWVLTLTMRVHGLGAHGLDAHGLDAHGLGARRWGRLTVFAALAVATTLPWIASVLLTDIFVGPAVLALHLLTFKAGELSRGERAGLVMTIAFAAATHSATLLLMIALGVAVTAAALLWPRLVARAAVPRIVAALLIGLALLLAANAVIARRLAWTPGGYGIVFGRLLEDGIVNAYLDRHCPDPRLRLCPYRHDLPRNADVFLWGNDIFNTLGRFDGLGEEMRAIVLDSLAEYPWLNLKAAASAAARQLVSVASGEGVLDSIWHTYGMIEDHTPWAVPAMRAARQQRGELRFEAINRLHVPVALAAMAFVAGMLIAAARRRRLGDLDRLAAMVALAILANACILGPLSNPHDRYGARIAWLAPFVAALWAAQRRGSAPAD